MYVLVTNRNNKKMLDVLGFTCWERDMEGRMWGRARGQGDGDGDGDGDGEMKRKREGDRESLLEFNVFWSIFHSSFLFLFLKGCNCALIYN